MGRGFLDMRIPAPGRQPGELFFNKKGIDSRRAVRLLLDRLAKTWVNPLKMTFQLSLIGH